MDGIWIFLLLLLAATLPALVVFLWFRVRKSPVTLPWFLLALAAGAISLLVAAFIQRYVSASLREGLGWDFFNIFIRIALVEEFSRIVTLVPLLEIRKFFIRSPQSSQITGGLEPASVTKGISGIHAGESFGAALGLAAGLGFALVENALYGTADINIALLRAFSAAPLHSACGIRTGTAVFAFRHNPLKAVFLFITAVVIHGAYNLLIISPIFPSAVALRTALVILFAFAVFFTAIPNLMAANYDKPTLM